MNIITEKAYKTTDISRHHPIQPIKLILRCKVEMHEDHYPNIKNFIKRKSVQKPLLKWVRIRASENITESM
jgi:hypothetical protein